MSTTRFRDELLGNPTSVMQEYLFHFEEGAHRFLEGLEAAAVTWDKYVEASAAGQQEPRVLWSAAYFLSSINCALISTRLFLEGYIVASGNQARHAVESLAFGVLMPFPATGAFRDWSTGKHLEHKALERLARNAEHCGINRQNVEAVKRQAKWFDNYSHPSRLALASAWVRDSGWSLGALFDKEKVVEYKKEIANRISMTRLLSGTISGVHRELVARHLLSDRWAR